jgi:hypothetical protein
VKRRTAGVIWNSGTQEERIVGRKQKAEGRNGEGGDADDPPSLKLWRTKGGWAGSIEQGAGRGERGVGRVERGA